MRALAAELAEDAAATKLVRRAGLRVRLARRLFDQPLGQRSAGEVWRRQLRWSRLRRAAFPRYFALEILTGSLPPLAAGGLAATWLEWPVPTAVIALAMLWYGAEAALAHAVGWHLSRRSPAFWLLRDLLAPLLWVMSWVGTDFVWRGNQCGTRSRSLRILFHGYAAKRD
jgi:ceramide glucosyltransferase